ncbi:Rha family transcriptional regulator [Paenibacillus larvae]|nr:Rha family transcriptional regulator [Paenibacillus larvae]MDT2294908.1 Rha family transcriptional regulator [Paenibacillus larvae]
MNQLVFIENGKTVTDSLTVAEVFGKRHADVLRIIHNLECSDDFNERNFASVDYLDGKGDLAERLSVGKTAFHFLGHELHRKKKLQSLKKCISPSSTV